MRVAIIGAGPTGLFLGATLQRRGHAVTVVDRDGGPEPDGSWPRKGVMQFHHAHAFRSPVAAALERELPGAFERWVELGAEPVNAPDTDVRVGIRSQRPTFERALREVAAAEPGLVGEPSRLTVYVDARTAKVLTSREHVLEGTGTGGWEGSVTLPTTQSGTTYSMTDSAAPSLVCQNAATNTTFTGSGRRLG
jgi:2-polyprenyl-6-methoxyphenol hydroxylase-like FAD-dependent oxidoreductase